MPARRAACTPTSCTASPSSAPSPGIADEADRAARRAADDALADHIDDVGVEAFLDEWLAQPLFAGLDVDDQQRADRLTNTAAGLASSLRHAGTGAQASLWPRLRELNMPVLTIAGALDEKFTAIGRQIAASVPEGRFEGIAGRRPRRPSAAPRSRRSTQYCETLAERTINW